MRNNLLPAVVRSTIAGGAVGLECLVNTDNIAMFIKDHKTGEAGVMLLDGRIVWLATAFDDLRKHFMPGTYAKDV